MRCRKSREFVSLALDDLLDEADRLALTEHLGACPRCRRHEAVLLRGRQALRSVEPELSENFEWKVQLGIQKAMRERAASRYRLPEGTRRPFWRPALASAVAVAALVVLVGAPLLRAPDGAPGSGSPSPLAGSATPDLSGAVRVSPLDIDVTRPGFGIRTVGTSLPVLDPRLGSDSFEADRIRPVFDAGREGVPARLFIVGRRGAQGTWSGTLISAPPGATLAPRADAPDSNRESERRP